MKSESLRDMMLAITVCDAATIDQRTRAAYLARQFDPDFDPVAWLKGLSEGFGA